MEKGTIRTNGTDFTTRIDNDDLHLIIEALDYAIDQGRTSCVEVFSNLDLQDGIDTAYGLKRLLESVSEYAHGTIIVG